MYRISKQSFLKRIFHFVVIVAFPMAISGQPSYHVDFYFKLYDHNGNQVDYKLFCEDYQLLGEGNRNDQTPCTNEYVSKIGFYNDSGQIFNAAGEIVYNDLVRKFIYQTDTMTLILNTGIGGNGHVFKIDSLVVRHGIYFIEENSLPYIDFKKGEVDYYNLILNWFEGIKKTYANYLDSYAYHELNRLRQKYGIDSNDYNEKSIEDIFR